MNVMELSQGIKRSVQGASTEMRKAANAGAPPLSFPFSASPDWTGLDGAAVGVRLWPETLAVAMKLTACVSAIRLQDEFAL